MKWEYRLFPVGLDRADQIIEDALNKHGMSQRLDCSS
jgi:hypothetical protein